ncbi:hypothetical protein [Slackia heliotrinireducens]|uniref:hypothetical protein n=1 Tax=Slackia heliotrinireducens TaxID=84110 RepID=UPI00331602F8
MYSQAKAEQLAPFEHAVDGDPDAFACVVYAGQLADVVRTALEASFIRLEYDQVCYANLAALEPGQVIALVEALDPMALVVVGRDAASVLGEAYRCQLALDDHGTLLGRPYAAFASFEEDMDQPKLKQRNWALLKTLKASHA